jgi:hypothetical protein
MNRLRRNGNTPGEPYDLQPSYGHAKSGSLEAAANPIGTAHPAAVRQNEERTWT